MVSPALETGEQVDRISRFERWAALLADVALAQYAGSFETVDGFDAPTTLMPSISNRRLPGATRDTTQERAAPAE